MSREMTAILDDSRCFLSFVEDVEHKQTMVIYQRSSDEEYYLKSAINIAFNGEKIISALYTYLIKLDEKFDVFNDTKHYQRNSCAPSNIANTEPLIMAVFTNNKLIILESDFYSNSFYKPAKELILNLEATSQLYYSLQCIYGIPIRLRHRFQKEDYGKEIRSTPTTGWDLLS